MNKDNTYLKDNQHARGHKPNATCFKKGMVPWNKGLKGIHLSPGTEFKKGCKSNRRLEVGTITQRLRNRDRQTRNFIKIDEPNVWCELARRVWEQEYGSLKSGDVVHHINGDTLDDQLENLIALPRTDHPIFHSRWGLRQLSDEQRAFYIARYK